MTNNHRYGFVLVAWQAGATRGSLSYFTVRADADTQLYFGCVYIRIKHS